MTAASHSQSRTVAEALRAMNNALQLAKGFVADSRECDRQVHLSDVLDAALIIAEQAAAEVAAKAVPVDAWQPIDTAPSNEPVVVFWLEDDDTAPWRFEFDYIEDGCWVKHAEHYEHVIAIGGHGVKQDAPYTHWKPIDPFPVASTPIQRAESKAPAASPEDVAAKVRTYEPPRNSGGWTPADMEKLQPGEEGYKP